MRIVLILLGFCISVNVLAQDFKFGKVSKEELEEKYYPLDSAANAAYLFKYRRTYYNYIQGKGFNLVTEIHERVKIYNKDGFDYATKSIPLYKSGVNDEIVSGLKGYTFSLDHGNIEEYKLKKDGIFKTEMSKYYNETKFTMPNVREGVVLEYQYEIRSPFHQNVDIFEFQHDIPIKKLESKFEVPEYFNFKKNIKGFLNVIAKEETKQGKITFKDKTRTGTTGLSGVQTNYSSSDIQFRKYISTYNLSDVPALKDEPYVNNINNYRSSVKYELSYTQFPNSVIDYRSTTWEDVVKTIYKSDNFGGELDKTSYYKDELDTIIATISDPKKRAFLILNFVKNKVKWNGYYGKYARDGVRRAFKEQVGNVAEINLMLTSMLRYAGLNANPVLVSTRQNGVPLFPTLEGYNYVISYIKFPEGTILLDATSKYSMPNVLPFRTLNWQGRVVADHGGSTLINLYPSENSTNTISMMARLSENGDLEGSYRSVKTNHNALSFRNSYNGADEDDFLEKLENKYDGMEISDYKVVNATNLYKPITESYKFFKESQADVIGDKIYFSPMFFLRTSENPFKLDEREFPVDFGYPSSTKFRCIIAIPEGYKIESIPEKSILGLPDKLGSFEYNISHSQSQIQLVVDTKINVPIISPFYYQGLKEYFNTFIQKEAEQIVLSKV